MIATAVLMTVAVLACESERKAAANARQSFAEGRYGYNNKTTGPRFVAVWEGALARCEAEAAAAALANDQEAARRAAVEARTLETKEMLERPEVARSVYSGIACHHATRRRSLDHELAEDRARSAEAGVVDLSYRQSIKLAMAAADRSRAGALKELARRKLRAEPCSSERAADVAGCLAGENDCGSDDRWLARLVQAAGESLP